MHWGMWPGLIKVLSRHFSEMDEENHEKSFVRTVSG
jgi:hypothetical protein